MDIINEKEKKYFLVVSNKRISIDDKEFWI